MKRYLRLILVCVIVVFLSGCGGGIKEYRNEVSEFDSNTENNKSATAEDKENQLNNEEVYYAVGMHINVPYWQEHKRGLEVAAKELGINVVFTGERGNDAANQINIFERVIEKKPSGILVSPIDPEGMAISINKAIDAGIPVVCIDTDAPKSKRLCYFGTDNYKAGWTAAEILSKAIGEEGEVGILSIPGVYSIDERVKGFKDYITQNCRDIKIVALKSDEGDISKAASVTLQMIQASPSLKGIFGGNSISGVGAASALREAGKTGNVKIVSMDRDAVTLKLVESGIIEATMVQKTFTMSYYATKFLYDYNHNRVKIAKDMTDINPLPQRVDTGVIVVDKNNVEKFK
ncbi:substrate-binding domain-containing protein [Petroclostridium sp. X23]|uniref:substrate-binding domain-containing protein n=1 Tax=Petroclostridium sp. X23 TaxID=3045146 RepID=UPI0024AD959D|nr:substrate-binding domain-containing protein [Petroclostridium sp. X23]WHH60742.1 substrate-binding domain-containing protein [Petroclostridium sp. X23]